MQGFVANKNLIFLKTDFWLTWKGMSLLNEFRVVIWKQDISIWSNPFWVSGILFSYCVWIKRKWQHVFLIIGEFSGQFVLKNAKNCGLFDKIKFYEITL